jgi:hypothetical protein
MDGLPIFVVGSIGDRAGVDDAYICLFAALSTRVPTLQKRFPYRTALSKIQLAT